MKTINTLIVEDHYLIIEGYKSILQGNDLGLSFEISTLHCCEDAFHFLSKKNTGKTLDIVFLDWSLPPYETEKIFNGGDLVKYITSYAPLVKIVVLTSHVEAFTLYEILKEIKPAALLTKSDFSPKEINILLEHIFNNEFYYSPIVKQQIKNLLSSSVYLDNYNRQIILLLSKGIKTKSLPQYLPLSISAIDKRKSQIKDYFLLQKGGDEDIVTEAKKAGLI